MPNKCAAPRCNTGCRTEKRKLSTFHFPSDKEINIGECAYSMCFPQNPSLGSTGFRAYARNQNVGHECAQTLSTANP